MTTRILVAVAVAVAFGIVADDSDAACNPGDRRPGIHNQGIAPGSVVKIVFDPSVNASGCARDMLVQGMQSWAGTKGVSFSDTNADIVVTIKPTAGPGNPDYEDTAWASTSIAPPPGGFQNGYLTEATVYLQPKFMNELDVANGHCNGIAVVGAHEFGHVLGLGHHEPGVGGYWLMQENASLSQLDGMLAMPSDCDRLRAEEAATFTPAIGNPGSPPDLTCGVGGVLGYTDETGCCILWFNFNVTGHTNIKPVGHIMAPLNNSAIPVGSSGTLYADAKDVDGRITRVGWYVNGQLMHTDFSEPWTAPYSNAPAGVYIVRAAVYDSADEYVWTDPVTLTVGGFYAADTLQSGAKLWPGWTLVSANSAYYLRLETNGNVVLYTAAGAVVASTGTFGTPAYLEMEKNGRLALRFNPSDPQVVWYTSTGGHPNFGAGFRVLGTGSAAIINRHGSTVWAHP